LLNNDDGGWPRDHFAGLEMTDGDDTYLGRIGELLLAPIKQSPSRPALRR